MPDRLSRVDEGLEEVDTVSVEDRRHRPRVLKVRHCLLVGSCWFLRVAD